MIFLDVGAHEGQTLEEVTKEKYGFEVYAYEPMPYQYMVLQARFGDNPHVKLFNCGLADEDTYAPLYGDNKAMDATMFKEKRDTPHPEHVTLCRFVNASDVFRSLPEGELIVKLNCEGAEVAILDSLVHTGMIHRALEIMIDFDIRKVDGQEGEEARITDLLHWAGFDRYSLAEQVMRGATHQERIAHWLKGIEGRTW